MRQFGIIFKHELKGYLSNKVFMGVTIFLVIAISLVTFVPTIIASVPDDDVEIEKSNASVIFHDEYSEINEMIKNSLSAFFPYYEFDSSVNDPKVLEEKVQNGEIDFAIDFKGFAFDYYIKDMSMYDENPDIINSMLYTLKQYNSMKEYGLSDAEINNIMNVEIEYNIVNLGKDQLQNFFYAYVMVFALYMVILLYG